MANSEVNSKPKITTELASKDVAGPSGTNTNISKEGAAMNQKKPSISG